MLASIIDIWMIAKYLVLFALGIYIVFALVIIRQVNLMIRTLEIGFELPIRFIAVAHLFFAIGILITALVIL